MRGTSYPQPLLSTKPDDQAFNQGIKRGKLAVAFWKQGSQPFQTQAVDLAADREGQCSGKIEIAVEAKLIVPIYPLVHKGTRGIVIAFGRHEIA